MTTSPPPTMQEILREVAAVFQRVKGHVPARGPVQAYDLYNTIGNIEAGLRQTANDLSRAASLSRPVGGEHHAGCALMEKLGTECTCHIEFERNADVVVEASSAAADEGRGGVAAQELSRLHQRQHGDQGEVVRRWQEARTAKHDTYGAKMRESGDALAASASQIQAEVERLRVDNRELAMAGLASDTQMHKALAAKEAAEAKLRAAEKNMQNAVEQLERVAPLYDIPLHKTGDVEYLRGCVVGLGSWIKGALATLRPTPPAGER